MIIFNLYPIIEGSESEDESIVEAINYQNPLNLPEDLLVAFNNLNMAQVPVLHSEHLKVVPGTPLRIPFDLRKTSKSFL